MPDKDPANRMRRYHRQKSSGICTYCGTRPAEPGNVRCTECRSKNLTEGATRKTDRLSRGLCFKCGDRPVAAGHKRCQLCLDREKELRLGKLEQRRGECRAWQRRLKLEVLHAYGGDHPACECCGEDNVDCLNVDHVDGHGNEHRRQVGSSYIYSWLKQHGFPKGFRILCYTCNIARSKTKDGLCPAAADHARLRALRQAPVALTTVDPVTGAHVTLNLVGGPGCKVALPTVVADQPLELKDVVGVSSNRDLLGGQR